MRGAASPYPPDGNGPDPGRAEHSKHHGSDGVTQPGIAAAKGVYVVVAAGVGRGEAGTDPKG
jgi:hypothetical protein